MSGVPAVSPGVDRSSVASCACTLAVVGAGPREREIRTRLFLSSIDTPDGRFPHGPALRVEHRDAQAAAPSTSGSSGCRGCRRSRPTWRPRPTPRRFPGARAAGGGGRARGGGVWSCHRSQTPEADGDQQEWWRSLEHGAGDCHRRPEHLLNAQRAKPPGSRISASASSSTLPASVADGRLDLRREVRRRPRSRAPSTP